MRAVADFKLCYISSWLNLKWFIHLPWILCFLRTCCFDQDIISGRRNNMLRYDTSQPNGEVEKQAACFYGAGENRLDGVSLYKLLHERLYVEYLTYEFVNRAGARIKIPQQRGVSLIWERGCEVLLWYRSTTKNTTNVRAAVTLGYIHTSKQNRYQKSSTGYENSESVQGSSWSPFAEKLLRTLEHAQFRLAQLEVQ